MRTTKVAVTGIATAANRIQIGWQRLAGERAGQDLIEYALLAGMITVIIGAMLPGQLLPPLRQLWILIAAPLNWASGGAS